ncbi:hypothetical protein EYF80_047472 [Liparis tanakae]|uniref:Uncharacterized protein n=1 Tax=Liparis tanakae TaxID=230148 RepID=A0A4Z2FN85_9TELE|nr:hypothetical protein EYF80_047472 [Liparis tanakae]
MRNLEDEWREVAIVFEVKWSEGEAKASSSEAAAGGHLDIAERKTHGPWQHIAGPDDWSKEEPTLPRLLRPLDSIYDVCQRQVSHLNINADCFRFDSTTEAELLNKVKSRGGGFRVDASSGEEPGNIAACYPPAVNAMYS